MGLFSNEISTKSMVPLCRQLATSYVAGIPIVQSLTLVGDGLRDPRARETLRNMSDLVRGGATLGEAALRQKRLPKLFSHLLSSGEAGGRLDVMLRDLAEFYEDKLKMQRTVAAALAYPALQLSAAWFLGTFALRLVGRIGTERSFDLGAYFADYLWFQAKAMTVFGIIFLICVVLSRMGLFQWVTGWIGNHLWPIKTVARKFALARFFRGMSLLVGSGMNIRSCILNSAAMVTNPYVQRDLMQAAPRVAGGTTLVQAFSTSTSLSSMAREMIAIGEQTGNLEECLRKVSEYHLAEAKHAVQVALTILGVLILLAVAGVVAYVLITFYSRLYGGMLDNLGV
jgi:type IV pilus assembly protein PilC